MFVINDLGRTTQLKTLTLTSYSCMAISLRRRKSHWLSFQLKTISRVEWSVLRIATMIDLDLDLDLDRRQR